MPSRYVKFAAAAGLGAMVLALAGPWGSAQPEPVPLFPPGAQPAAQSADQPDPNAPPEGVEVLAKGPVHEAFAATAEAPVASPVVPKQPPDPIEELPPDQKPEGDNVQWIPGYWHWDDDGQQYIWISGFWRQPPPGRVWVPGSWRQVTGGWQWVSGFWQEVNPLPAPWQDQQQVQPEVVYLPEPPATLETGPTVPAPGASYFYSPGSWVWRGRYVWRPGVWVEYRADWVWVPAHFVWTPVGFVFVEGYWDYALSERGVLFAPVVVPQAVYARRGFLFTPSYVVSEPALLGALFVRRGFPSYFFGNYFTNRYATAGYHPWAGRVANGNFALGFGTGRAWGYDPLWSYYSVARRSDRDWRNHVTNIYEGRYTGKVARPPATLAQQNTTINKITNTNVKNVTNNVTVVNKSVVVNNKDVTAVAMVAPLKVAPKLQPEARIKPVSAEVRRAEAQTARQIRSVAQERARLEVPHAAQGARPTQPRAMKLDVPKALVTRAHPQDQKKGPPPPPIKAEHRPDHSATPKVTPKGEPQPRPKLTPEPKVNPKVTPKGEPRPEPKVNPKGEPRPEPKVNPKGEPRPKVEPKPKFEPPHPKAEPKPKANPPAPKVEPPLPPNPKGPHPAPHPRPKGEPPAPPQPVIPKVETRPQPPHPVPKVEPRPAPPRPVPKVEPRPLPKAEPPHPKGGPPPKHEPKHEPKKDGPARTS